MHTFRIPLRDAFEYVRSKRRWTNPNLGFLYQLAQWEQQLELSNCNRNSVSENNINGEAASDSKETLTSGMRFLIEHVRSIWPQHCTNKTDEQILQALECGHYNHVEVLYCLIHNITEPISHERPN